LRLRCETIATSLSLKDAQVTDMVGELRDATEGVKQLKQNSEDNAAHVLILQQKMTGKEMDQLVTDRAVREMNESLVTKASVSELLQLERSLSTFAKTSSVQDLSTLVKDLAPKTDVEKLANEVLELRTLMSGYARSVEIENRVQHAMNKVDEKLTRYAPLESTENKFSSFAKVVSENRLLAERASRETDAKVKALGERITTLATETFEELSQKAPAKKIDEIIVKVGMCAKKGEVERVFEEVSKESAACRDTVGNFQAHLEAQDKSLERIDELLLDKASKFDVSATQAALNTCVQQTAAAAEYKGIREMIQKLSDTVEHYTKGEAERTRKIRLPGGAGGLNAEEVLAMKADASDLIRVETAKANVRDHNDLASQCAVLRDQMEYVCVTLMSIAKLALTEERRDTKTLDGQRKHQAVIQAEALWRWSSGQLQPPLRSIWPESKPQPKAEARPFIKRVDPSFASFEFQLHSGATPRQRPRTSAGT